VETFKGVAVWMLLVVLLGLAAAYFLPGAS
jgi:hypothetical protein